ncbi:MAG: hypothetical protein ACOC5T_05805 [Elusimicrobiota bacterium]
MAEDEWTKIEPDMAPSWNGKDEDGNFKLEEGDTIVGVFKGKREGIGKNDGTIYEIKTEDGMRGIWGSTVIDTRFKNLEEGEMIKVVYKGQTKSKKSGREYYDYDVYHKQAPFEKVDDDEEGINPEDVPF